MTGSGTSTQSSHSIPVENWQQMLGQSCGNYVLHPKASQIDVIGDIKVSKYAGIECAHVSQNLKRITRDSKCLKKDPGDHFFLIFQNQGQSVMGQDEKMAKLQPGDAMLIDATRPSEFVYDGRYNDQSSVHLPREQIRQRYGYNICGGVKIHHNEPYGIALNALFEQLKHDSSVGNTNLAESFLGVLGSVLIERQQTDSNLNVSRSASHILSAALRAIDSNFEDPRFGPATLAEQLNISVRSLQRAFALVSDTPSKRLLEVRLRNAYQRLMAQKMTNSTINITSISYGCGFNDTSYFYRSFKKKYKMAPGKLISTN